MTGRRQMRVRQTRDLDGDQPIAGANGPVRFGAVVPTVRVLVAEGSAVRPLRTRPTSIRIMPQLEERQRLAAYGLARRANKVLLVRASPSTGVPGTWWLPGGGLQFGESPGTCLVREFMEETGLRAAVGGVVDVV